MKTLISKETFIDDLEMYLRVMSGFYRDGKVAQFEVSQAEYASLVHFSYVHDLLTDEEYNRYRPFQYCMFSEFVPVDIS